MILTTKVINKIIEVLFPKIYQKVMNKINELIEPLHKYVHEPNELDDKVDSLEKRMLEIENSKGCNCASVKKNWYDK